MEKEMVHKLFSTVEKNIALLKMELEKAELKKKNLQQQVLLHLADTCPDEYKRILGDSSYFLEPGDKSIENIFFGQSSFCKQIMGYSMKIKKCSIEVNGEDLQKNWLIEGQVGEISFITEFVSQMIENPNHIQNKEEIIKVYKLEVFPQSEILEKLALALKSSKLIKTLIPCLYMLQKMQNEKSLVEEILNPFKEVKMSEENDILIISIDIDSSSDLRIEWALVYSNIGCRFIHNILVHAEETVKMKFEDHKSYPVLAGAETLTDGEKILNFIQSLFER